MTGVVGDLTILANVKGWRSPPLAAGVDDAQLQREITASSQAVLQYLNRTLVAAAYTDVFDGTNQHQLSLRSFPIISVSSVLVNAQQVPASATAVADGYSFASRFGILSLRGFRFERGYNNISVTYQAGFLVQNEASVIPATPFQVACSSLKQLWAADNGVSYAGGAALSPVTASPAVGQYIAPVGPDGNYTFAAADATKAISISYSYTPRDVESAVIQMILFEYNKRDRIGVLSKTLAGETITYSVDAMPGTIKDRLFNYQQVYPVI